MKVWVLGRPRRGFPPKQWLLLPGNTWWEEFQQCADSLTFPVSSSSAGFTPTALPRQRTQGVSDGSNWQRDGERAQAPETRLQLLENDHSFVSSPWNWERMAGILCSHQPPWLTLPWNFNPWWKGQQLLINGRVTCLHVLSFRADSPKPFPPWFYVQNVGKDYTNYMPEM